MPVVSLDDTSRARRRRPGPRKPWDSWPGPLGPEQAAIQAEIDWRDPPYVAPAPSASSTGSGSYGAGSDPGSVNATMNHLQQVERQNFDAWMRGAQGWGGPR